MRALVFRKLLPITLWLAFQAACGGDARDGGAPPEADRPRLSPPPVSFDELNDTLPPVSSDSETGEQKPEKPEDARQDERCDPNYTPCVPIASDVDCGGGGGNGPAYVQGPVRVVGTDIYELDRDGDGIACDH